MYLQCQALKHNGAFLLVHWEKSRVLKIFVMPFAAVGDEPCALLVLGFLQRRASPVSGDLTRQTPPTTARSMPSTVSLSLLSAVRSRLVRGLLAGLSLAGTGCGTSPGQVPEVEAARGLIQGRPRPFSVGSLIPGVLRATPAVGTEVRAFYDSTYVVA